VLAYEGTPDPSAHEALATAVTEGIPLGSVNHEIIGQAVGKCNQVAIILDDDSLSAPQKVDALAALVGVEDPDRLAIDIEALHRRSDVSSAGEEEEIETAGPISPITLLTMVRAKGLSADHVILLGFDPINMGQASRQLFFVAMSRARQSLHLLTARKARGASQPHEFLQNIPEENCDHLIRTSKGTTLYETREAFNDHLRKWAWAARFGRQRTKRNFS
jgi:hypothetical protein